MALTELKIKKAKPKEKTYKLSDGGNLTLVVSPGGTKTWRQRVYRGRKEIGITLGSYPEVGLADARRAGAEARDDQAAGVSPMLRKARAAVAIDATFRGVARDYMSKRTNWSEPTRYRFTNRMERDVFPALGEMNIGNIAPPDVLATVRPIEVRGAIPSAKRAINQIGMVMQHAVALGLREYDPTAKLVRSLADTPPTQHRHALVRPDDLRPFLRDLWTIQTRSMDAPLMKAIMLTFARAGEVRSMRWADIDLAAREWRYDVSKVKLKGHIVPLSTQMLALLDDLRRVNGNREFVFAGPSGRAVGDMMTSVLIKRMGYRGVMMAHGARAIARTALVERLDYSEGMVEMQLSHLPRDAHGRAYNRVTWRAERHAMMQAWADWLDEVRGG